MSSITPWSAVAPDAWSLDRTVTMLNHGSFGACPLPILERQAQWRARMEAEPVRFLVHEAPPLLDASRRELAALLGDQPENLVFVANATAGVNAVLRSLRFQPGDQILLTNHIYNACHNVARHVAELWGAEVVCVDVPAILHDEDEVLAAVLARVTARTRLALIDHVTSPTAMVFPIASIVRSLAERGIDTLVDGAHAPGMVPVDLAGLGAAYYSGNCHKWLCGPKGAGFLYVRPDRQAGIQPPVISHGYNQPRTGYSRFQDAFDWQGTSDPTAWLCVGEAIRFLDGLLPGGIAALMERNHQSVCAARRALCERLSLTPLCPETMLGSMAAMLLPEAARGPAQPEPSGVPFWTHQPALARWLPCERRIQVPVFYWPAPPQAILRVSVQAYNDSTQFEHLASAVEEFLAQV